jgi:hypothetical protein
VPVALGFNTGTCCIDYKIDNGLPKLFEINPRYGASLTGDINRYLKAYLRSLGVREMMAWKTPRPRIAYIHNFLQSLDRNFRKRRRFVSE